MTGQLRSKVAIVTGANTGIGEAAALRFAREGAKVIVGARNAEEGEAVAARAREVAGDGGDARFVSIDVAERGAMQRAVEEAVRHFDGLHVAFNNAGIIGTTNTNLADQSEEDFDQVIDVNLKAVFMAMRAQIPAIQASGGGAVVNTSSVGGVIGNYGLSPYIASKHGVIGLTRAAALEYAKAGVRVNAIAPGATETRMMIGWMEQPGVRDMIEGANPMGRLATPDEVANAALWLASDASSYVTGAVIAVDGAYTAK